MRPAAPVPCDLDTFISSITPKKILHFRKKEVIFSMGERNDSIFFLEKGIVKLSVTSKRGKEAILGVFAKGELFGESCLLSDHPLRFYDAIALTDLSVVKIHRNVMKFALDAGHNAAYMFVTYLLQRNARTEEALINHLLGSSEERLAHILSLLPNQPGTSSAVPKLSQQDLAHMIGITRQRVNVLMKRLKSA